MLKNHKEYLETYGSNFVIANRAHEMYPAKIDDYLAFFPYRDKVFDLIEKEIF